MKFIIYLLSIIISIQFSYGEEKLHVDFLQLCDVKPFTLKSINANIVSQIKSCSTKTTSWKRCLDYYSRRELVSLKQNIKTKRLTADNCRKFYSSQKLLSSIKRKQANSKENFFYLSRMISLTTLNLDNTEKISLQCKKASHFNINNPRNSICNDFKDSILESDSENENLLRLISVFNADKEFQSIDDPRFCKECVKEKILVNGLYHDVDSDQAQNKVNQDLLQAKKKLVKVLSLQTATQEIFKISNLMEQVENFRYLYDLPEDSQVTCISYKKIEEEIEKKCGSRNPIETKKRINSVFKSFFQDSTIKDDLKLSDLLERMSDSTKESSVSSCGESSKVLRKHFFSYERTVRNKDLLNFSDVLFDSLFKGQDLFKSAHFNSILEKSSNAPISQIIAKYLLSNMKLDSENSDGHIKAIFSGSIDQNTKDFLKKEFQKSKLPYPITKGNLSKYEDKYLLVLSSMLEHISSLDPMTNIALRSLDNFKKIASDYFKIPSKERDEFSTFLRYGNQGLDLDGLKKIQALKAEAAQRYNKYLKPTCDKVKEKLVSAICLKPEDLSKFSRDDLKDVSKLLVQESTEPKPIIYSAAMCEYGKESKEQIDQIEDLEHQYHSLMSQGSDLIEKKLSGTKVKEGQTASRLDNFALSTRACNKDLREVDYAQLKCMFLFDCKGRDAFLSRSQAESQDLIQIYRQQVVDESNLYVSKQEREVSVALAKGKSLTEIKRNVRSNKPKVSTVQKELIGASDLSTFDNGKPQEITRPSVEVASQVSSVENPTVSEEEESDTSSIQEVRSIDENPFSFTDVIENNDQVQPMASTPFSGLEEPSEEVTTEESILENERARLIRELKELTSEFTPGQISKMSIKDLRDLVNAKKESKKMDLSELKKRKKKLEEEVKALEEKKVQARIKELNDQKQKLEKEKVKISKEKAVLGFPKTKEVSQQTINPRVDRAPSGFAPPTAVIQPSVQLPQRTAKIPTGQRSNIKLNGSQERSLALRGNTTLVSSLPLDILKVDQLTLTRNVKEYLKQAEKRNLLNNKEFVRFEKANDKVVAIFIKSQEGRLVRISTAQFDQQTQDLVSRYEKLSLTDILEREQIVMNKVEKIDWELKEKKKVAVKRQASLDALNAQILIYNKQIQQRE